MCVGFVVLFLLVTRRGCGPLHPLEKPSHLVTEYKGLAASYKTKAQLRDSKQEDGVFLPMPTRACPCGRLPLTALGLELVALLEGSQPASPGREVTRSWDSVPLMVQCPQFLVPAYYHLGLYGVHSEVYCKRPCYRMFRIRK